jgi:hypothetical protein
MLIKKGIARWDSKLIKGDRQMGFQVEEDCCKRQVSDQSSFNQISFGSSVLGFIFIKLTAQNLCSVSIIKRGHLL